MKTTLDPARSTFLVAALALTSLALFASACSLISSVTNELALGAPQAAKLPTQEPSPKFAATSTAIPTSTPTEKPTGTMLLHQSNINGLSQLQLLDIDYGTHYQLASAGEDQSYPSWTPDGRSIVYLSSNASSSEIHMMAWDGSGDRKLSREMNAQEYVPVVSPDGTRIAFFASYPGHWALFIMRADGSDPHPITENTVFESVVSWSPDSRALVFTPWHNTQAPPFIASVGSDGQDFKELTNRDDADRDPVYSPDGTWIAYTCHDNGMPQICVMRPDGSARVQLTTGPGGNDGPVWSPDGNQIAFVSWRDSADPDRCQDGDCNFEVYVMDADGADQRNLSSHPAEDWYPAWSTDGSRIAFVSLRDEPAHPSECGDACNSEIYIMDRNGENPARITDNTVPDWNPLWRPPRTAAPTPAIATPSPLPTRPPIGGGSNEIAYWAQSDTGTDIYLVNLLRQADNTELITQGESADWSPDGKAIAFTDYLSTEQSQLFVMNADGTDRRQITFSDTSSSDPAWSPDGKEIAFARDRRSIYIHDLGSGTERLVLEGSEDFYFPAWSPDGQELAFLANSGELVSTLMVATSEGSDIRLISDVADWSSPPAWSPEGEWIAYGCFEDEWQVCKVDPQGGVPQVITHVSSNGSPSWSPDGQWLAFISYRDDNWEVYVMRADGSDQQRISNDWLQNFEPVWRP